VDVVWLQDDQFPTYSLVVYFADGSLSDSKNEFGVTNAMFNLLPSGTRRYGQKDISDYLEFYGASLDANITHEYSTYSVSGLAKDIIPTMKQVCQLFSDATFPANEIEKEKRRAIEKMKNLVNDHSSLASMIFREVSMQGTPYSYPSSGKIADLKKIGQISLRKKLEYFSKRVKKRIYITGPKEVLAIKPVLNEECGWKGSANDYTRLMQGNPSAAPTGKIIYVNVPNANQAQIRIGKFLKQDEIQRDDLMALTSSFLGGGFTSKLMRAVRYKGGLTYSISAIAAGQKEYGRSFIATFTKNESVSQLLDVVKSTIAEASDNSFTDDEFELARGYLVGSYPFGFEKSEAYLAQIITLEHEGRPLDELYSFPDKIKKLSRKETANFVQTLYPWNDMTILILGDKKVGKELSQKMKMEIYDYQQFL
jgi:zinc protease